MTDLSSAYSSMEYYTDTADIFAPPTSPRQNNQQQAPPPAGNSRPGGEVYDVNTIHKQIQQEQQMAQLQKQLQQMQQQQQQSSQAPKNGGMYYEPQPSFFDSLWARRRDMTKYLVLALVVLLGLSMHSALEYQLKKYILENDLSAKNETMVRFGYPVLIFCILWVIKVFMKS